MVNLDLLLGSDFIAFQILTPSKRLLTKPNRLNRIGNREKNNENDQDLLISDQIKDGQSRR